MFLKPDDCDNEATARSYCHDTPLTNEMCEAWANDNQCVENGEFMEDCCKQSCGVCPGKNDPKYINK